MKKITHNHKSIFYITLCLTLICWIFLFAQLIRNHIPASRQNAIPAFQSIEISAFPSPPDSDAIYAMLKKYDSDIQLVSCHQEKNYTDLYFYTKTISNKDNFNNKRNFNLQVAITKSHVYFGSPIISYDF